LLPFISESYVIPPAVQEYTKNTILPVVFCGCETWSLTLREEHRLRVFENRVLTRIFGPKRDDVMGKWRKLHNEELHNLYSFQNIVRQMKSRRMRWAGIGRWDQNESRGGGLDLTGSGKGPMASCCECGYEPSGSSATELVIVHQSSGCDVLTRHPEGKQDSYK
jgi:hypothetical protein